MAQFGIRNSIIPPAPEVNDEDFNVIALCGIAPQGPAQALTVCANPTDDTQFGSCLTGFSIPRALSTIRQSGGGKVVVINVFNPATHTSQAVAENQTVVSLKCSTTNNPIPGSKGARATIVVSTPSADADTLAGISVQPIGLPVVQLLAGPLTLVANATTATEVQIATAINANTSVSGYTATGVGGTVYIVGPAATGVAINGVVATVGTVTGTMVLGTPSSFSGGIGSLVVQNTAVSPVSAVAATETITVTTGAATSDTLTGITVGLVQLLAGTLTFASGNTTATATAIKNAINANTSASGFTATSSSAIITISGSTGMGATINGVTPVLGTVTGTVVIGSPTAFSSGVTAVTAIPAHNYVLGTEYTVDAYGKITFLIPVSSGGNVVRATYSYLNQEAVVPADIIGTVSGSTRTGLQLIQMCKTTTGLRPKHLIVPNYNSYTAVQTAMELYAATPYRMRTYYGPAKGTNENNGDGLTMAQALASRQPGGVLATFNNSSVRAIDCPHMVYTYDPQAATGQSLEDPSAALAGFMAWNASINGPQNSPSNQVMPAVLGTEYPISHAWEDPNNASDANQFRSAGLMCIINDTGGFKWWGGENSSYPSNAAVNCNISVMYVYDILTDNLTDFAINYVDRNITSGSIAAFLAAANAYYSTQATDGVIGGSSEVLFLPSRNTPTNLAAGIVRFTRKTYYFVGMKLIILEEDMEVQLPTIS